MVSNWIRRHPRLVDAVMVLTLALFYVVAGKKLHRSADGLPIAAVEIVPLLVRRRFPLPVLAVVTAATLVEVAVYGSAIVPLAAAVAVYTVAANLDRRTSLIATATSGATLLLLAVARDGYGTFLDVALPFGVAWVVGDSLGTRRAYMSELELRAERLEREQQAEAARAIAEEQARIARELHDVIAHNVSVMVVHAAAGRAAFNERALALTPGAPPLELEAARARRPAHPRQAVSGLGSLRRARPPAARPTRTAGAVAGHDRGQPALDRRARA